MVANGVGISNTASWTRIFEVGPKIASAALCLVGDGSTDVEGKGRMASAAQFEDSPDM